MRCPGVLYVSFTLEVERSVGWFSHFFGEPLNLVFTKGLKNLLSSLFELKKSLEIGARYYIDNFISSLCPGSHGYLSHS
jgi:hypothetical protein